MIQIKLFGYVEYSPSANYRTLCESQVNEFCKTHTVTNISLVAVPVENSTGYGEIDHGTNVTICVEYEE